jgi:hypothetical protein
VLLNATGGFRAWRRSRPLVGGVLIALGGLEMFFSGQLDVGRIHIQLGIEGFQATVIPIALVLLGVLIIAMPVHRVFYGVIALAVAVYSLVGVNLGGFFVGMLLSSIGGILAVSWAPRSSNADDDGADSDADADAGSDSDADADAGSGAVGSDADAGSDADSAADESSAAVANTPDGDETSADDLIRSLDAAAEPAPAPLRSRSAVAHRAETIG